MADNTVDITSMIENGEKEESSINQAKDISSLIDSGKESNNIEIPDEIRAIEGLDLDLYKKNPEYRTLAKRYHDSSTNGKSEYEKRILAEEKIKASQPDLERAQYFDTLLREDPVVFNFFDKYLNGTLESENKKEISPQDFGLESMEDFDLNQAISDPQSKHGRYWEALNQDKMSRVASDIEKKLDQKYNKLLSNQNASTKAFMSRQEFLEKNPDVKPEEYDKAMEYLKKTKFNPMHAITLMRSESGEPKNTSKEIKEQMKRASVYPNSIASMGGDGKETPNEEQMTRQVFDFIKKAVPFQFS